MDGSPFTRTNGQLYFLPLALGLLFSACAASAHNLTSETIFRIPIGAMRDEINLFSRKSTLYNSGVEFTLTPLGSYYIVDHASRKILYYTNYGKLNHIIYNPNYRFDSDQQNPNYLDKIWQFGDISKIAASQNKLYITSTTVADATRQEHSGAPTQSDTGNQQSLANDSEFYTQTILTFDGKGEFLYQLGSEGKNGPSFLYRVIQLYIDSQKKLLVVTRRPDGYHIYRFSNDGDLLSSFELSVGSTLLSNPTLRAQLQGDTTGQGGDAEARRSIEGKSYFEINAPHFSTDGETLFFELYRYTTRINTVTSKTRQVDESGYDIYSIRIAEPHKSLKKNFMVRDFGAGNLENREARTYSYGEQLMGATEDEFLVFLQTYSDGRNVLAYRDRKGNQKYIVTIGTEQEVPRQFFLAPNGLISALNFYEDHVRVNWWRTDKLFRRELSF